jgi:sugar phosphate isomerase/epimerase
LRRAGFPETVEVAAAAGFRGVSVYQHEYAAARGGGWSDHALRAHLDAHGIAVSEVDGAMAWLPGDAAGVAPGDGTAPRLRLAGVDEFVECAVAVGARSLTALEVRGRRVGRDIPWDAAAEAFAVLCDRAATERLLVHLEYFPWSGIPDLATALEVVRRAGRANGGVLVDLWHHVRGPDAGSDDFADTAPHVLAVHVNDTAVVAGPSPAEEARHGRELPGAGAGRAAALVAALRSHGCSAPLEVEVTSDAMDALPPLEAARRAMAALRAVVAGVPPPV